MRTRNLTDNPKPRDTECRLQGNDYYPVGGEWEKADLP